MRNRFLAAIAATTVVLGLGMAASPAEAGVGPSGMVPIAVQAPSGEAAIKGSDGKIKLPPPGRTAAEKKRQETALSAAALPEGAVYRYYGIAYEFEPNLIGVFAGMKVAPMYLNSREYHTLNEIAIQTADQQQTVEVGWGHGGWCHNGAPCLFVYHWVNQGATCYPQASGQCGWTDYAGSSLNVGDSLAGTTESAGCTSSTTARNQRFGLRKNDTTNAWMVWADLCFGDATAGQWIGEFSQTNWTSKGASFTSGGLTQVFGEIAGEYKPATDPTYDGYPCTDMGPGGLATSANGPYPANGQRLGDITYPGVANADVNLTPTASGYDSTSTADMVGAYEAHAITGLAPADEDRYFNVGGPGFAAANGPTKPGTAGGC